MSDDTGKQAFAYFSAEWSRVPMGMSDFIDRQWRRTIEKTDQKFGEGTGKVAAEIWEERARDRILNRK